MPYIGTTQLCMVIENSSLLLLLYTSGLYGGAVGTLYHIGIENGSKELKQNKCHFMLPFICEKLQFGSIFPYMLRMGLFVCFFFSTSYVVVVL